MSELFIYYGKSHTKYPAIEISCPICGKNFLVAKRFLNRSKIHCCSQKCANKFRSHQKQQQKLDQWASEKHVCEHCGKVMTEKFGSGRFCCKACANSHQHSTESKLKIAYAINNISKQTKEIAENKYYTNPKYCKICGKIIPYEHRHANMCSDACRKEFFKQQAKAKHLGGLTNSGGPCSRHGTYKGIHCDSSYELIFLIYCLENNIKVERNRKYFKYININGEQRKYYPDFYLPETFEYIELKGYKDQNVDLKINSVINTGNNLKILYKVDLITYLDFINIKFNKHYKIDYCTIDEMYDRN